VNAYGDAWLSGPSSPDKQGIEEVVAASLDRLVAHLDIDVVLVVTQRMDQGVTERVVSASRHRERLHVASCARYGYEEIAGILSRVQVHVGMRTHSLILASAVGTPVVSINAYPKTLGFMKTIGQDAWSIELPEIGERELADLVFRAWEKRAATRVEIEQQTRREKKKARAAARVVGRLLRLEPAHGESTSGAPSTPAEGA
jgi:polysaccharide pyruvyl transferase WcaK-like protein